MLGVVEGLGLEGGSAMVTPRVNQWMLQVEKLNCTLQLKRESENDENKRRAVVAG